MKEVDALVESIASGLKAVAADIEKLADQIGASATSTKAAPKAKRKRVTKRKKAAPKKRVAKKATPVKKAPARKRAVKTKTASDVVRAAIYRTRKGLTVAQLRTKTGFNDKKIANIIYKLKKQGVVVSPAKGLYKKP